MLKRRDILASIEERVESLLKEKIEAIGYELYDVEYSKEGKNYFLRIFIDKTGGIDLNDCGKVNNEIDEILDEADYIKEQYFLEVSSPGIERIIRKEKHLKNIWNEKKKKKKKDYTVTYTEDAIRMMDERMILKSDVERVLADYRESQEAVLDEETKELVARSRLGNVTFWVRFIETEEGYLVRRAYSHRMNIMKRVGQ